MHLFQEFDIGAGHNIMAYYFLNSVSFKIKPRKNNDNNNERFQILLYQWLSQTPVPTNKDLLSNPVEVDSC